MARVQYVERDQLNEDGQRIFDHIAETRGSIEPNTLMPNSFRALMNSPKAAEAVGQLGEYLRLHTSLDPVVREIAIISVARHTNSDYEWAHHEPIAREVGVRPQVIESIRTGQRADGPSGERRGLRAGREGAGSERRLDRTAPFRQSSTCWGRKRWWSSLRWWGITRCCRWLCGRWEWRWRRD